MRPLLRVERAKNKIHAATGCSKSWLELVVIDGRVRIQQISTFERWNGITSSNQVP
jgi:hypothetical protein